MVILGDGVNLSCVASGSESEGGVVYKVDDHIFLVVERVVAGILGGRLSLVMSEKKEIYEWIWWSSCQDVRLWPASQERSTSTACRALSSSTFTCAISHAHPYDPPPTQSSNSHAARRVCTLLPEPDTAASRPSYHATDTFSSEFRRKAIVN